MTNARILATRELEYIAGRADGEKIAATCNDHSDYLWHAKVAFDNLHETRPHYLAGYTDALAL